MIDEKLLLDFIITKKKEFKEESFSNYEKYINNLKNMGSMGVVTATVDIYVLMNLTHVLNELIEIIESGKFDIVEKSKKLGEINEQLIGWKNMNLVQQMMNEYNILNDQYNSVCRLLEKEHKKNRKLKNHHKSSMNLVQQINRSVLEKNYTLTKRLHKINQLLIELYKEIDKNYTQSIENNDELSINYEKSKLDLITKIFDEVNKID